MFPCVNDKRGRESGGEGGRTADVDAVDYLVRDLAVYGVKGVSGRIDGGFGVRAAGGEGGAGERGDKAGGC